MDTELVVYVQDLFVQHEEIVFTFDQIYLDLPRRPVLGQCFIDHLSGPIRHLMFSVISPFSAGWANAWGTRNSASKKSRARLVERVRSTWKDLAPDLPLTSSFRERIEEHWCRVPLMQV